MRTRTTIYHDGSDTIRVSNSTTYGEVVRLRSPNVNLDLTREGLADLARAVAEAADVLGVAAEGDQS